MTLFYFHKSEHIKKNTFLLYPSFQGTKNQNFSTF